MIGDAALGELAGLVAVGPEDFDRTFGRAQAHRDERADVAVAAAARPEMAHVPASFAYARDSLFLKALLLACMDDQVAGPLTSPNGRRFAELCHSHAQVEPPVDPAALEAAVEAARLEGAEGAPAGYERQALNPEGFDVDARQHAARLQSNMQMVCRIDDLEGGAVGTGVLIAPHLVATAAHVVDGQVDETTKKAREGGRHNLRISLRTVAGPDGQNLRVALAEDWLAGYARCTFERRDDGEVVLPHEHEVGESHDVAVLRLESAPGLQLGWMDVSRAGQAVDQRRKGLIFHHHPGGADQAISHGSYANSYGSRFKHSCSSLGGSSGGPLINHQDRLVGLHNGRVVGEDGTNLGGGGSWLSDWWRTHPQDQKPGPELNPIWEVRSTGPVGSGDPVIGFDEIQRLVWDAQLGHEPRVAVVTMPPGAGSVLGSLVREMLPPSRATVAVITREELDRVATAVAADPTPVTSALESLAARLPRARTAGSAAASPEGVASDAARAQFVADALAGRLREVQNPGPFWLVVGAGNGRLTTAVSEALGHMYRAVAGMHDGRGRLVVASADSEVEGVVADLLSGAFAGRIEKWAFDAPDVDMVRRYVRRWFRETRTDAAMLPGILGVAGYMTEIAKGTGLGDSYASLVHVLREQARHLRGQA